MYLFNWKVVILVDLAQCSNLGNTTTSQLEIKIF